MFIDQIDIYGVYGCNMALAQSSPRSFNSAGCEVSRQKSKASTSTSDLGGN